MPRKASSPQKKSTQKTTKKKPSAKAAATERIAERRKAPQKPKVPASHKEISQSRFPGETPLTGEDRPRRSSGGKKKIRTTRGK